MNTHNKIGAVVLAAGFSSRMKSPKPFLKFDPRRVFIEKIIDDFVVFGCSKIVVTINPEIQDWKDIIENYKSRNSVIFKVNDSPDNERFYSIKTGIESIGDMDYCFIHNSDNPFLDNDILKFIYAGKSDTGYTVPCNEGKGGHPVLLGKHVMNNILAEKDIGTNFKEFLKNYERINVNVGTNKILININTQKEYEQYFKRYKI
ncbi:MAG: hypothetical protein A2X64_08465 [Ignavibacteria bacterium GWF2_33_9]|nr:MAG: hypothetical protein A2X64_08465 [Ignavibacteria bacterium GWF2_33_9]